MVDVEQYRGMRIAALKKEIEALEATAMNKHSNV